MRIGLIQTRGIGDVIIGLPIAQYLIENGHEVHWPVDARFRHFFQAAAPEVHFHPIDTAETGDASFAYFYEAPLAKLNALGCERIHCLYSALTGVPVADQKLVRSLKFDEYKYAVSGVPFSRKWSLLIKRDAAREQALFNSLGVKEPYTLVHTTGSNNFSMDIRLPDDLAAGNVVYLTEKTDNPFDWLSTLERAAVLILVDSLYSNLVEQLNLPNPKVLLLRSEVNFTPVFKNGWMFR